MKQPNPEKFLKGLVSDLIYGEKIDGHIFHCNTQAKLLNAFGFLKHGFPRKLSQRAIRQHLDGERVLYFTGNSRREAPRTLVMIDVDVGKAKGLGSPQGALDAVALIRKALGQDIHFETSAGGKGQNGYFILEKQGCYTERINSALRHLETYLNWLCRECDIEKVEIKGLLSEWQWENKACVDINMGSLARMPLGDISGTQVIRLNDIGIRLAVMPPREQQEQKKKRKRGMGSCCLFGKDIERQLEESRSWAKQMLNRPSVEKTAARLKIVREDYAVAKMVIDFCCNDMNSDGSLPVARIRNLWEQAFEMGLTDRQFDGKRFAAIRNTLDKMHLIEWESNEYCEGQACKWSLVETSSLSSSTFIGEGEEKGWTEVIRPQFVMPIEAHRRADILTFVGFLDDFGQWKAA